MTASGRRLDRLAELEEQRDFLLRSLDDLEQEFAAGDLDEDEFVTLRDDYTRRAADVARAIDSDLLEVRRPSGSRSQRWWWVAGVAVLAVVAGFTIAQYSGQRAPGGSITGDIDQSVRSRVAEAERLFASGDVAGAREMVDEVLIDDRDLVEALLLSAQIHENEGDLLEALRDLGSILEDDPDHVLALSRRGWILVRFPEPARDEILATEGVDFYVLGIEVLDQAIALDPTIPDPFLFRGAAARYLEADYSAAIGYYEEALERSPPEPMVSVIDGIIGELRDELAAG
jgi:tetratricopeptide (TPR) repeat protein